jgi:hypothetical protein
MNIGRGNRLSQAEAADRFSRRGLEMIGKYVGAMLPVTVRCMKCGFVYDSSINLIHKAGRGCAKCGGTKKLTQQEASDRYSAMGLELLGKYRNSATPVVAKCLKCSCEWNTIPYRVFGGKGCPDCADKAGHEKLKLSREEVDDRFLAAGAVIIGKYVNVLTPVLARCLMCDYEWRPFPSNISRSACPKCKPFGFSLNAPAILYYVKIHRQNDTPVYKIGVTSRTVRKRFGRQMDVIKILKEQKFSKGADAYKEEQRILMENASCIYAGPRLLKYTGVTEMFSTDVLGLDPVLVVSLVDDRVELVD